MSEFFRDLNTTSSLPANGDPESNKLAQTNSQQALEEIKTVLRNVEKLTSFEKDPEIQARQQQVAANLATQLEQLQSELSSTSAMSNQQSASSQAPSNF